MNEIAYQKICEIFNTKNIPFKVYKHEVCRTSEESRLVRKNLGLPDAIGAKALLCKLNLKSGDVFAVLVLPGTHTLDKAKLKLALPELKQFRFATQEELANLAGVVPGCMPPFGKEVFSNIDKFFIAKALFDFKIMAFNAAKLDTSILLNTEDYLKAVSPDAILDYSNPKVND